MNAQHSTQTNRTLVLALIATLAVLGALFSSHGSAAYAGTSPDPFTPPLFDTALTHDGGQPCGIVFASSPMVADLNGDGKQEIIVGTEQTGNNAACLAALNSDGTPRWVRVLPGSADSTAAVADLNGDGKLEIVLGYGSGTTAGGVAAYDRDGNRLWQYTTLDRDGNGLPDAFWASPAVVDVNGDGTKQVAIPGWDMRMHLINGATGTAYAAPANNPWPAEMLDTSWSSPAIADIDGDGRADIVFGGDISANSAAGTQNGGLLRVMHNEPGVGPAHTAGFNVQYGNLTGAPLNIGHYGLYVDQALFSSPVVADFGARGKMIIEGSGCAFPAGTNCNGTGNGKWVKVWSASGPLVATLATDAEVFSSPIVADVNGDGVLDIIATTMANNSTVGGTLVVWSGQPGFPLLWSAKVKNFFGTQNFVIPSSPVAADIFTLRRSPRISSRTRMSCSRPNITTGWRRKLSSMPPASARRSR